MGIKKGIKQTQKNVWKYKKKLNGHKKDVRKRRRYKKKKKLRIEQENLKNLNEFLRIKIFQDENRS